ncbi:MAG: right-handed parallel beta-helix repeat-containing protein [Candidatus Eiseniibacteriota bacterium]|jgi:hypothetical protein
MRLQRSGTVSLAILAAIVSTGGVTNSMASTILVPTDVPTIQGALDIALPGDLVLVEPGAYEENLIMVSDVELRAEQGPQVTAIDGRSLGPVITCHQVSGVEVHGFTIRHGWNDAFPGGAGVSLLDAEGVFVDCTFVDNQTSGRDGGGISVASASASIVGCRFHDNEADAMAGLDGGGVFAWAALLLVEDCVIHDNLASEGAGIAITNGTSAVIDGCLVHHNQATGGGIAGGGLIAALSTVTVESSTFVSNTTAFDGACLATAGGSLTLRRNIVAFSAGNGVDCGSPSIISVCNDVWGSGNQDHVGYTPGLGDFNADPGFCDAGNLDFTLQSSSPCAPLNSPAGCGLIGVYDVGCGPVAIEGATWGRIKATYSDQAN